MRLLYNDWKEIREWFTQQEKDSLNNAVVGESICPRALTVDDNKLEPKLIEKLNDLLNNLKKSRQE